MKSKYPIIELISIGTELLSGFSDDRDFSIIAHGLSRENFILKFHTTIADDQKAIKLAFKNALKRANIIIATGGLGPTTDDITREAVSAVLKRPLIYSTEIERWIKDYFKARSIDMPDINRQMAYYPEGFKIIKNNVGNAPGLALISADLVLFLLPGPPYEMEPMFIFSVLPELKNKFSAKPAMEKIFRLTGISESAVQEKISKELGTTKKGIEIAYLAYPGDVMIKLTARQGNVKAITELASRFKALFNNFIYASDNILLGEAVGMLLKQNKKTIALAESCTGGLVADRITDVPGSSEYFQLGVVAYSNRSKVTLLGVLEKTLEKFGAVSAETAAEMAIGVRQKSGADIGVSVTGIAGPSGGSEEKPVGLVYFALADDQKVFTEKKLFRNNRAIFKQYAAQAAMDLIRRYLLRSA